MVENKVEAGEIDSKEIDWWRAEGFDVWRTTGPQACLPPDNPGAFNMKENEEEVEVEEECDESIELWQVLGCHFFPL